MEIDVVSSDGKTTATFDEALFAGVKPITIKKGETIPISSLVAIEGTPAFRIIIALHSHDHVVSAVSVINEQTLEIEHLRDSIVTDPTAYLNDFFRYAASCAGNLQMRDIYPACAPFPEGPEESC
jgi:hypothetical protein